LKETSATGTEVVSLQPNTQSLDQVEALMQKHKSKRVATEAVQEEEKKEEEPKPVDQAPVVEEEVKQAPVQEEEKAQ
jgi:hypothetical protein